MKKFGFMCFSALLPAVVQAGLISVTLDTSALVADAADQPFALEFDLANGALLSARQPGPVPNPSNVVTISNFDFGGGHAFDPANDPAFLLDGGASGDIRTQVVLRGTNADNYLSQGFQPGATLSFVVGYTNNVATSNITDSFDFGILDNYYNEVPTKGNDIFNSFLVVNFNDRVPTVSRFASEPQVPTTSGQSIRINAPDVTILSDVPEPGTFWTLVAGGAVIACFRSRRCGMLRH